MHGGRATLDRLWRAGLILELLLEDRFPQIWMPSTEQRDLRTLLRDRHQWVKMRARLQHTLQAIALNHALRKGRALWSAAGQGALEALPLPPYTGQKRTELLSLYVELQKRIQELEPGTGIRSERGTCLDFAKASGGRKRIKSVLPVRLWIAGSKDSHLAHTLDVSSHGAVGWLSRRDEGWR